ncbi:MAG: NAD(P)/FAD-dependent oxidoreductase [Ktedonobacteraceae bacterium]|nr:NAD(P)/FAD-dependent oxidoreductase [Ktedonobacteraceae bacterium]
MDDRRHFDAIIIGAGLGGLLSAAHLLRRGKRVVVVERLNHCGGRFTAKQFQGVQVSTGAVHMVPFGSSGVLAHTLRLLNIPHRFFDADVFGSFHVHGKHYRARGLPGVYKFLGPRQFFWFLRIGYLMFFRPLPQSERALPFDLWLERHINVERNPQLVAFFERIARFALSLELHQVSTAEVIQTTKHMFRYGAPAIVQGGCGEITRQLEQYIVERGGEVRLSCPAVQILQQDGCVTGVRVQEKTSGQEVMLSAPLVISDIGPRATRALLHGRRLTQAEVLKLRKGTGRTAEENTGEHIEVCEEVSTAERAEEEEKEREAVGLKVHILSDISLIPHKGIMYCLDTRRIAGIVQPTNSDPALAPPGKHLLISHQVIQSDNIEEERALALADLRMLFGEAFDKHCRVLTMSTYRGEWPVNRIVQGEDVQPVTALKGLYLVGDAVKPSGYLMVEGVAQSVNRVLDLLDTLDGDAQASKSRSRRRYEVMPPPRIYALRWLWEAPGNSGRG